MSGAGCVPVRRAMRQFIEDVAVVAKIAPDDDPEPIPPIPPEPEECCQSGCVPCVYDRYNDEMDEYREQLRAWRARHESTADHGAGDGLPIKG